MTAKKAKTWCFCDLSMVAQVGKCKVCKQRQNRHKRKLKIVEENEDSTKN